MLRNSSEKQQKTYSVSKVSKNDVAIRKNDAMGLKNTEGKARAYYLYHIRGKITERW